MKSVEKTLKEVSHSHHQTAINYIGKQVIMDLPSHVTFIKTIKIGQDYYQSDSKDLSYIFDTYGYPEESDGFDMSNILFKAAKDRDPDFIVFTTMGFLNPIDKADLSVPEEGTPCIITFTISAYGDKMAYISYLKGNKVDPEKNFIEGNKEGIPFLPWRKTSWQ